MRTSIINLPCRSHRGCTYHKHWNSSSASNASPKNSTRITTSTFHLPRGSVRLSLLNTSFSNTHKLAPIQTLPPELLLSICGYLSPISQTSLALTCRSIAFTLGPSVCKKTSKAGKASWWMHSEMLDVLQKDFKSEEWWRCEECLNFHQRVKASQQSEESLIKGLLDRSKNGRPRAIQFGMPNDPLYILDFELIKGVMDRHFLGPAHGVCLNTMKCQGSRTFPLSKATNVVLKYDFTPKIVLDSLLLQSTYSFQLQKTMFVRNVKLDEISIKEFLAKLGFWICKHAAVVEDLWGLSTTSKHEEFSKCEYCPTEYGMRLKAEQNIKLQVYHNVGAGRTAKDPKWLHLSRGGKERKVYEGKREDIAQAYQRVYCSTKEEFERQMARSDGLGNYFDRSIKMCTYKTLPLRLADRF
ncbi:hypothetical protein K469DRAFT_73029 [Zopfia rhizophila CBS 207.26]|uniref:F-box domain-containing protein n=1 Tax=Zopfia rhizophila CBS 207.26 TaxID=1314779 RepID=A0A6A6EAT5_9PEZI|nr:hypothetical protein K469DRAFT_73029 [Zopfia rhizophila CBS 207.26]